ncbi:MAG: insulinase family protein [Gammaproteobacteria bacterium]|nr:insulinase family protein [Gammaproteobacteria bacterium]MCW8986608.1 insulinase family protein [Gammaproteobacteria bacterium]
MRTGLLAFATIYLTTALASTAAVAASEVHEFKMANGMKVLVKEDHRAPIVVSQVWYKVGSSYEYSGITGVSHVLEHMMFKGTNKHPAGEFSRIIAENGGRENAFTGKDFTAYFQQLEKSRLQVSFEMEADRMRNLLLPEEEFKKELAVVMEERRMRTEDKASALTTEQFFATAYTNHPYHQPIIGWMNDLENLQVADLRSWYEKFYAPNNATLVVVGDVKAQEVFELAKIYFADLKPSDIASTKPRLDAKQKGERRINVKAPARIPYIVMGYKVPSYKTAKEEWEPYALDVLAYVLSGGSSSRFPKSLVRKQQIAVSADTGYGLFSRLDEMFLIDGTPAKGYSVKQLEKAINKELEKVKKELVSEQELERIKAQAVAEKVYEKDSVFYQAMQIGMLETVGLDWRLNDEYTKRIREVTAEQIQAVAKKYLVKDTLTVAVLDPQPLTAKKRQPTAAVRH